jgi:hypothetical protein
VLVNHDWGQLLFVRPARLEGPDDPLLTSSASLPDPAATALRLLADPGVGRLVEGLRHGGTGWAQDPLVTAAGLVRDVSQALGVATDPARLYLQLLALPDPSDSNVARWNGWSAAEVKAAAAALVAVGAVVEGKRVRASRGAFLPGGWLDVKAPMPPIEQWKVTLLGLTPDGRGPLGITVPTAPVGELFQQAWERVSAGDGPRLEQLDTRRRR